MVTVTVARSALLRDGEPRSLTSTYRTYVSFVSRSKALFAVRRIPPASIVKWPVSEKALILKTRAALDPASLSVARSVRIATLLPASSGIEPANVVTVNAGALSLASRMVTVIEMMLESGRSSMGESVTTIEKVWVASFSRSSAAATVMTPVDSPIAKNPRSPERLNLTAAFAPRSASVAATVTMLVPASAASEIEGAKTAGLDVTNAGRLSLTSPSLM